MNRIKVGHASLFSLYILGSYSASWFIYGYFNKVFELTELKSYVFLVIMLLFSVLNVFLLISIFMNYSKEVEENGKIEVMFEISSILMQIALSITRLITIGSMNNYNLFIIGCSFLMYVIIIMNVDEKESNK